MTVHYRCPISTCPWFTEYVASASAPECPADILSWSPVAWASMSDRAGRPLSVAQVIDAHLSTHSPVEWMTELRRLQARAEAAETELDETLAALTTAKDFADVTDALTSMRMPTRAELEDVKAAFANVINPQPEELAS